MAANTPMGYLGLQDAEKLSALLELDAEELGSLEDLAEKKTELLALADKADELLALLTPAENTDLAENTEPAEEPGE